MNDQSNHPAIDAARRSVDLLLGLGPESYRTDLREHEGKRLSVSPLAGQEITTKLVNMMHVGSSKPKGIHHVLLTMTCAGHQIQAHCMVHLNYRGDPLVEASIYVDDKLVVTRNVGYDDGIYEPWGMPENFSMSRPEQGTMTCSECDTIAAQVVEQGQYFVTVADQTVVDTEAIYNVNPRRITKLLKVVHLTDGNHEIVFK